MASHHSEMPRTPFITDRGVFEICREFFKFSPKITSQLPIDAMFSLIPMNQEARDIVEEKSNQKWAHIINHNARQIIGLTIPRPKNPKNSFLLDLGRRPECGITIPRPWASRIHLTFEVNLLSRIPLIRAHSSKCYALVGDETLGDSGQLHVSGRFGFRPGRLTAALLPNANTLIMVGNPDVGGCIFRVFWHDFSWFTKGPMQDPEDLPKSLAPTLSFEETADQITRRTWNRAKDLKPPKPKHLDLKMLGSGDYGRVVKAINMTDGRYVAVKRQVEVERIDARARRHGWNDEQKKFDMEILHQGFMAEITALSRLDHDRIIKFYGWEDQGTHVEVYLDLKEGSADSLVQNTNLPRSQRRIIAHDLLKNIAEGLIYLHDKGFVHRDLWGPNILYEKTTSTHSGCRFFIGDLGHCLAEKENDLRHLVQFNVAPELWTEDPATWFSTPFPRGTQSDIYGLFVTAVTMIEPTWYKDCGWSANSIVTQTRRARNFKGLKPFQAMSSLNPDLRPNAREVLELIGQRKNADELLNRFSELQQAPEKSNVTRGSRNSRSPHSRADTKSSRGDTRNPRGDTRNLRPNTNRRAATT